MQDLNSLIDPRLQWTLVTANDINNAGQITGSGLIGGQTHAYLLTPVPEPASLLIMTAGVSPFFLRRRRKKKCRVTRSDGKEGPKKDVCMPPTRSSACTTAMLSDDDLWVVSLR